MKLISLYNSSMDVFYELFFEKMYLAAKFLTLGTKEASTGKRVDKEHHTMHETFGKFRDKISSRSEDYG